ncbi:hypothetical protein FOZ61_007000 [Perkinsus olseni]|uniref:Uncharacterized protein n=1 Tax=Perkinsus olseni TaxID=32597 RepID=A0A7J6LB00_PEROL|nr:hypothetical protein FOZ61_007000 [Perkinsus olseni]
MRVSISPMSVDARETSSTLRLILDPEILNRILSRLTGSRYQAAEVEPPVLYKEMEWFAGISSNITIPVCDPVIYEVKGCFEFTHTLYSHSNLTEYAVRYHLERWPLYLASRASDDQLKFNLTTPPITEEWPRSWNFERDVKEHPTLCKSVAGAGARTCGPECIEDTSCMAPAGMEDSWTNARYLLVFGGRTFENREYKGKSMYNHCEEILMKEANIDEELRGCLEYQSEELWRYDLMENQWDFIKPLSSVDDSSGEEVGVPHGRYGHSAAMVILDAVVDPDNVRRQYMYIYGGMSMNCLNGLCSDMWRIEVPWAPTAYWPTMTPLSEWRSRRPSRWVRMKDCKYGGRFRHGMEAAPSGDLIFVFGGNVVGKWENSLLV